MIYLSGGWECACRSRGGCEWVWASLSRYGQRRAKVGRSGYVRLIGRRDV